MGSAQSSETRTTYCAAHAGTRPSRATTALDGEACAPRLFCENGPDLTANHSEIHNTIPTVSYFINKPSGQTVFTMARSSGTRACTGAATTALGGHASQPSPSLPRIASWCSPWCEREAMGDEAVNRDMVPSSLHGGGPPTTAAAMFPWAQAQPWWKD